MDQGSVKVRLDKAYCKTEGRLKTGPCNSALRVGRRDLRRIPIVELDFERDHSL